LRHLLGITKLDKENNQCIRGKTGAQNIVKKIKQYQEKWLQHVQRMDTNRIPKEALQYEPKRRRNIGRLRKRNSILEIKKKETRLILPEHDNDDDGDDDDDISTYLRLNIIFIARNIYFFQQMYSLHKVKG
jgi:hypothetical protein